MAFDDLAHFIRGKNDGIQRFSRFIRGKNDGIRKFPNFQSDSVYFQVSWNKWLNTVKIASSLIFRGNDNWDFHHHLVFFLFQGEYWRAAVKRMSFPRTAQAGKAIPFWSMQFKQKLFTILKQTICFKMILMRESLALRARPIAGFASQICQN